MEPTKITLLDCMMKSPHRRMKDQAIAANFSDHPQGKLTCAAVTPKWTPANEPSALICACIASITTNGTERYP